MLVCVRVALINWHDKDISVNLPDSLGLDFQYDSTPKPGAHKGSMRKVAKKLMLMCTSALSLQNV